MTDNIPSRKTLSIVVPCYNEEKTLEHCICEVLKIQNENLDLEILIVDDCSTDTSYQIAQTLAATHTEIKLLRHSVNKGKGAALRSGFKEATGDYVAIQDADLEYEPRELLTLLKPLVEDRADVVLGSRFLTGGPHRVLYFWHSVGNMLLTLLSNMLTDLNLTDMETCYKVFKREVIQSISLKENRFGFEPEIVAKVAQKRVRVFEIGISYYGRTFQEGKKIGMKDGFRAVYCILKYNMPKAPLPLQFLVYLFIGGAAAMANLLLFMLLLSFDLPVLLAAGTAFAGAAIVNYILSISILFRHQARWSSVLELMNYTGLVGLLLFLDAFLTRFFIDSGMSPIYGKLSATFLGLILNFLGRKYLVFPEEPVPDWQPQNKDLHC